jgi:hypothetical protein
MVYPAISAVYAALVAGVFLVLSARVISYRRRALISLGDGDDLDLRQRMRAQANCAEYAPLALLLLVILDMQGAAGWVLHGLGALLLTGRILHAVGFSQPRILMTFRVIGTVMTTTMIAITAILILLRGLSA